MTELLEKAFAEAANLPEHEQDMLAKALLDDLAAREQSNKKRPKFGSAKGSIQMSDDFNEPLQDFADYME